MLSKPLTNKAADNVYVIETELGRFEGEDEREAKKKLRAAQRAERKKEARYDELYELARTRARATGFLIYERVILGKGVPSGWRFYEPNVRWGVELEAHVEFLRVQYRIKVKTAHGTVTGNWQTCDKIVGSITNGNCECIVLFTKTGDLVEAFVPGIAEDVLAVERLEGVNLEFFTVVGTEHKTSDRAQMREHLALTEEVASE